MKVLFAVSECIPFVKSGGLADVAGSLPKQLKNLGIDVRVIMPKYGTIPDEFRQQMKKITEHTVQVGWRNQYCGIEELHLDEVHYYFIDNEYYFKREKLYGFYDDGERFAYFCRAVIDSLPYLDFYPDVIHCHDWHTAMISFLLKVQYKNRGEYQNIRSVLTIHNLKFQGIMPRETVGDLFGLSDEHINMNELEYYGNVNLLKGGIVSADKITTVSSTYREEIQVEYYGEGLDGLLRKRKNDLIGILNGIDDDFYNPEKDNFIYTRYNEETFLKKKENKQMMQQQFALPINEEIPLMVLISRLTKQKGIELVRGVFHEIMENDIQFIILGTGEEEFEHFFREMEHHYPNKFKAYIAFHEPLAHQLYAASDLFLMPSKFEPCGLGQMIALKYGSIPIVRETGGLNDTVKPYNEFTGEGNGFTFRNFNAHDMLYTIRRALTFYENKNIWNRLVKRGMAIDNSWNKSALQYKNLYGELIRGENHVF